MTSIIGRAHAPSAGHHGLVLRSRAWVAPLCWFAVVLDGFDAVVLGAAIPAMLEDPVLGLTPASATAVATTGLVGMMFGSLSMGWLSDRFGRRRLMIGAVITFSLFTLLAATTSSVALFAFWRFLAGLGLGGALPSSITMVTEFARPGSRGSAATVMMTGYHVGAVLTATLAIVVLPSLGWHALFVIGAAPALVLVPLMWRYLPESPEYYAANGMPRQARIVVEHYGLPLPALERESGRAAEVAAAAAKRGPSLMLAPEYRSTTVALWVASFVGLLLVYGLNTWLPQIMRAADYDLGNSLGFLVVLNAGGILGLATAGRVADRFTPRTTTLIWFLTATLLLSLLAIRLPMVGTYVLVFVTGAIVFSSQTLVIVYVASVFPGVIRGTAVGLTQGIGRVGAIAGPTIGGTMVTLGVAHPWGFFTFAGAALIGAAAIATTRTRQVTVSD